MKNAPIQLEMMKFWKKSIYIEFESIEGLTSRCKQYSHTKYEYKDFFKVSDIRESRPSGYILRLVFYAQGTRNAHVLLSRTTTPNLATEPVYEFSEYNYIKLQLQNCNLLGECVCVLNRVIKGISVALCAYQAFSVDIYSLANWKIAGQVE